MWNGHIIDCIDWVTCEVFELDLLVTITHSDISFILKIKPFEFFFTFGFFLIFLFSYFVKINMGLENIFFYTILLRSFSVSSKLGNHSLRNSYRDSFFIEEFLYGIAL